jgi:hypothetical protein
MVAASAVATPQVDGGEDAISHCPHKCRIRIRRSTKLFLATRPSKPRPAPMAAQTTVSTYLSILDFPMQRNVAKNPIQTPRQICTSGTIRRASVASAGGSKAARAVYGLALALHDDPRYPSRGTRELCWSPAHADQRRTDPLLQAANMRLCLQFQWKPGPSRA